MSLLLNRIDLGRAIHDRSLRLAEAEGNGGRTPCAKMLDPLSDSFTFCYRRHIANVAPPDGHGK